MLVYDIELVREQLENASVVMFDTETSSKNPYKDGKILAGIALKTFNNDPFYLPFRHFSGEENIDLSELPKLMQILEGKRLVMHNCKFDMAVVLQEGFNLNDTNEVYDTMVLTRLVYEDLRSYELKVIGKYVDPNAGDEKKVLAKYIRDNNLPNYAYVPPSIMAPYATKDVVLTEGLYLMMMEFIKTRDLNEVLALEIKATRALFDMEAIGFQMDMKYVHHQYEILTDKINNHEKKCFELAGEEFNINSTATLGAVFRRLGVRSTAKTPTGKDKWAKDVLSSVTHPLAQEVLEYRKYYKLNNTYYSAMIELTDNGHALHCNLNQAGARTGRCSCRNPNLQNIPKQLDKQQIVVFDAEEEQLDEEEAGKVRTAFVPRPGFFLLFTDWSQVEPRIVADYARETDLLRAFKLAVDTHLLTAVTAFGKMPEDKNSDQYKWVRGMGKTVGLAIIYGVGKAKLAGQIGRTPEEAMAFKKAYLARFRKVDTLMKKVEEAIVERGWIKNRYGRRRYLPKELSYVGFNFLIQGSAADMMKEAIVNVNDALKPYKSRLLLTIHDELVSEIAFDEYETVIPIILGIMKNNAKFSVPFRVDPEWATTSWAEKTKLECPSCEGGGINTSVPKDELLMMIVRGSFASLSTVTSSACEECNGQGFKYDKIDEYVRTHKEVLNAIT